MFDRDKLPELARFLETHLILCYRNGKEWYDVHPLITGQLRSQSARTQVGDRIVHPEG